MNLENIIRKGINSAKKIALAGLASSVLFFSSCKQPVIPPESPPEKEENPETYVLSGNELEKLQFVSGDVLKFSEEVNYSSGDVLVCDISNLTPNGLLRKVKSVSSDGKTVYTEQASLENAVEDGSFEHRGSISPSGTRALINKKGISTSSSGFNFKIDINNVILYDSDGDKSTTGDQIIGNGEISFNSDYVLDFEIKNHNLDSLTFKKIINENCEVEIKSDISARIIKKVNLVEYDFPPFVAGVIPGTPIPVIIKPNLEVGFNFDGGISSTKAIVTQEAVLTAGLNYENGRWSLIKNFSNDFDFSSPESSGNFNFKASAGPELNFLIYGLTGPYGKVADYLELNSDENSWQLYGGLEALLGVKMEIFSKSLADYSKKIIEYRKLLDESESSEPPQDITTITIQPGSEGKDAWVRYVLYPDGEEYYYGYPDADLLEIQHEFIGSHGIDDDTLIEFPLFSIPSNARIISGKLKLYGYGNSNYTDVEPVFKVRKIIEPWDESSVNWDNKPNYGTNSEECTFSESKMRWNEWDITTFVKDWIEENDPNYGIALMTTGNDEGGKFKSGDYSEDPSKRPKLIVSYY